LLSRPITPAIARYDAHCLVANPTGTPLNVRSKPNGAFLGALHNDTSVALTERVLVNGKIWGRIVPEEGKRGWVFFDFLSCE
jgi:hypothetical protein